MSKRIISAWVVPAGIDLTAQVVQRYLWGCHECPMMMKDLQALKFWQLP